MKPNGQLVAINSRAVFVTALTIGPSVNRFILHRAALRQMHLFVSRTEAFRDDDVLQENVIIRLERSGIQGNVTVSNSTDDILR